MVLPLPEPQVDRLRIMPLTYSERGRTYDGGASDGRAHDRADLPPGYHHLLVREVLGRGDEAFEVAAQRVLTWQMHERAGLRVEATDPAVVAGAHAVVTVPLGPVRLTAPVRVVHVVREPDRAGFSYGTLPGHPERGEEGFYVDRAADGTVTATIIAFSQPDRWFTRLAGPVAVLAQRLQARRYARALR